MTRSTDPGMFDQRVADWLEDDPNVAPGRVLDTVLAALPSISQRRAPGPWARLRLVPAPRFGMAAALLAAVALLLVALVGVTITGPPMPSPTPVTTLAFGLSGAMATFTSPLYGYSVDHPVEWTVRSATEVLHECCAPWIDSLAIDYIAEIPARSNPPGLIVAAAELTSGRTLDAWTDRVTVATCGEPGSRDTITVDGESGALLEYAACYGLHHLWATVIHDGVGYHIVWIGPGGTEAQDRALFDAMVATFRFPATPPLASSSPAASPVSEPLPDALLGAWYHPAPAFMTFFRAGDPYCVDRLRTELDCALWHPVGLARENAIATLQGNALSLAFKTGFCSGGTTVYTMVLSGDSLSLTERPGGCQGGNLLLIRAGTGGTPTSPPEQ